MTYKFFPHTEADVQAMLQRIGVESLSDLYADVPEDLKLKRDFALPGEKSEIEVRRFFDQLAQKNQVLTCFAGAGTYDHYAPAIIPTLIGRSEFLTSYTPYQAEVSQGTLHYIFEFQSMMAELTGMDVSNASMYDGSTATAEAMLMAANNSKKSNRVLISATMDEKIIRVVQTYAHFQGVQLDIVPAKDGVTDHERLQEMIAEAPTAGLIVQQPNRYGIIEDFTGMASLCHDNKALFIINSVAADLALLKTPGEWGADVAVGDGQSLGIPMSYGGPGVGYMCVTEKLMRKMPGRIVGQTADAEGRRAFVLTLQAREQHIRRQKATSNICSNQSLMALYVTIYMALMGNQGLKEAAQLSCDGALYLYNRLIADKRFTPSFQQPFLNEFCVDYDGNLDTLLQRLADHGILGGVEVDGHLMIAVTEQRTKEEIDLLISLCHEQ